MKNEKNKLEIEAKRLIKFFIQNEYQINIKIPIFA